MANRPLTGLQPRLIRTGARALRHGRVVRHARTIPFRLAEVAVTGQMVRTILAAIRRLRAPGTSSPISDVGRADSKGFENINSF